MDLDAAVVLQSSRVDPGGDAAHLYDSGSNSASACTNALKRCNAVDRTPTP